MSGWEETFMAQRSREQRKQMNKILTAALTVANSTTALPFFLFDTITFKTSPY